jgi:hypothetical protein
MIEVVRNQEGDSIARADVNESMVHLSLGIGAYQVTEFTPEQARQLAQVLIELADKAIVETV